MKIRSNFGLLETRGFYTWGPDFACFYCMRLGLPFYIAGLGLILCGIVQNRAIAGPSINSNGLQTFQGKGGPQTTDYGAGVAPISQEAAERVIFTGDASLKPYGQADLYREGVQTLSTVVLYKVKQIETVQRLRNPNTPGYDQVANEKEIRLLIGETFCGGDDGETCAQRFLTMEEPTLRKYRYAIAQGQISASELQDGTGVAGKSGATAKRTEIVESDSSPTGTKKAPPKVKTLDSLRKEFKDHESAMLSAITDENEIKREAVNILLTPPNPKDFIVTEKVLRDPNNKEAGEMFVQKLLPNGQPAIDQRAYQEALNDFKRRQDPKNNPSGGRVSLAEEYINRNQQRAKELGQELKQRSPGSNSSAPGFTRLVDTEQQRIFLENQHVIKEETQNQFDPNSRSIASKRTQTFAPKKGIARDISQSQVVNQAGAQNRELEQVEIGKASDKLIDVYYAPSQIDTLISPAFIPLQGPIPRPTNP